MLSFSPKFLPGLDAFVASEDIRYYLKRAHAEPGPDGGVILVTTQGHCLMVMFDADGSCDGPTAFQLPKFSGKDTKASVIEFADGKATFKSKQSERFVSCMSCPEGKELGRFPDWRVVFDEAVDSALKRGVKTQALNPTYLGKFNAVGRPFTDYPAVMIFPGLEGKASVVMFGNGKVPAIGILMPMNLNYADVRELPAWTKAPTPPVPAAEAKKPRPARKAKPDSTKRSTPRKSAKSKKAAA